MALLARRQSHSLVLGVPRPPKQSPNTPVQTDKSIDPTVFVELFAGTVGIFVLAVLFWKLGKFIRRFNRNKVLRAGKSINTRYSRTWYGWVSQETHEKNKKAFREIFTHLWNSTAWKSTRDDYSWVWWDPGDLERQKRRREKRGLWWLPNCFKSYEDCPTADEIWNPCAQTLCHGALGDDCAAQAVPLPVTAQTPARDDAFHPFLQRQPLVTASSPVITRSILEGLDSPRAPVQTDDNMFKGDLSLDRCKHAGSVSRVPFNNLKFQSLPSRRGQTYHVRAPIPWSGNGANQDISCSTKPVVCHMENPYATIRPRGSLQVACAKTPSRRISSHRHCGWSARMQLGARRASLIRLGDSSGPPGTPMTEMLASCCSEHSSSLSDQKTHDRRAHLQTPKDWVSFTPEVLVGNRALFANEAQTYTKPFRWNSAPARNHGGGHARLPTSRPKLFDEWRSNCDQTHCSPPGRKRPFPGLNALPVSTGQIQLKTGRDVDRVNEWEVRMLERLDRKLVWVFNEFTPGQKPYHFAILANHWMNRETWIVYDPISRVSTDARRAWGDPRYNVPYPEPVLTPRPKYPFVTRKRAHTPRIDSWRAAVNEQRTISGIREAIRTITLYEESAEEPPDGRIDPASWALPKPPQGFQMSTAQQNAWYEGGAGWQEKLHDWRQVHRGYRVHKALHEGRVNRERMKEAAAQINRTCRPVTGRLISTFDGNKIKVSTPLVA